MNTRELVLIVAIAAFACAPRETALPDRPPVNRHARITPADLAGCYRVEIGQWQPAIHLAPPADIQLTLEEMPGPRAGHGAVRPSQAHERRLRFRDESDRELSHSRKWRLTGPSDAELAWSSDTVAVQARVTVDRRSRDLSGTVRTIDGPRSSARIRLVRKPC